MEAKHYDSTGAETGTVDLSAELFGAEPSPAVVHQAIVARLANRRQGTAATKGRSDVNGTNRKPFKQKKTGNARRGDLKTNVQRGGGIYGGPTPRSYRQKMPKKQRQAALRSALSIRASEQAVAAIEDIALESGKTRDLVALLRSLGVEDKRVVLVTQNPSETLLRAGRNIPSLVMIASATLHPFEIMWAEQLLFTDSALQALTGGSEA